MRKENESWWMFHPSTSFINPYFCIISGRILLDKHKNYYYFFILKKNIAWKYKIDKINQEEEEKKSRQKRLETKQNQLYLVFFWVLFSGSANIPPICWKHSESEKIYWKINKSLIIKIKIENEEEVEENWNHK